MQPYAQRLALGVRDECLMKIPGPVRRRGVALKGYERSRVADHTAIQVRMQPRHGQCRRGARTLAERRASLGIRRECHLKVARDARQHLGFDEVYVTIGYRVVLDRALAARPWREQDGHDGRDA